MLETVPIIIFLCIIIAFFYLLIIKRNPSELPSVLIDQKVPLFETTSLFNNEPFIFEKELGKETILVNFFASWCVPCRVEHTFMQSLSNEGIKIIGINYKDDPQQAIKWLEELGNPYSNVAIDSNGRIAIDWGVYGIPETFIVNTDNIIEYRHVGPLTKKEYNKFHSIILEIME